MQGVGIETDAMGAITFITAVDRTSIPAEFAHMQGTGNAELVDQAHPCKAGGETEERGSSGYLWAVILLGGGVVLFCLSRRSSAE